jgi:hypothetical protein
VPSGLNATTSGCTPDSVTGMKPFTGFSVRSSSIAIEPPL